MTETSCFKNDFVAVVVAVKAGRVIVLCGPILGAPLVNEA